MKLRSELEEARAQRDESEMQLEKIHRQLKTTHSDARVVESRCRDLDDALAKTRRECRDLRAIENQCVITKLSSHLQLDANIGFGSNCRQVRMA